VGRLATGWMVPGSNAGGGKIFSVLYTHPYGTWCRRNLTHSGYEGTFSGVKWKGRGGEHPPNLALSVGLSRAKPSRPLCAAWLVTGRPSLLQNGANNAF
jgi:hypothetical protein